MADSRALPRGLFQKPLAWNESSDSLSEHPVRDRRARGRRASLQSVENAASRSRLNGGNSRNRGFSRRLRINADYQLKSVASVKIRGCGCSNPLYFDLDSLQLKSLNEQI